MAVALAFAMAFGTVAEAAECGTEAPVAVHQTLDKAPSPTAEAARASDSHHGPAGDVGGDRGFCQHGHCHHAGALLSALTTDFVEHLTDGSQGLQPQSQHLRSRSPTRLERPPRV